MRHLNGIEFLRRIAIILVVVYHIFIILNCYSHQFFPQFLFFALSVLIFMQKLNFNNILRILIGGE